MASAFPEKPTNDQRKYVEKFFKYLSQVFPCPICAGHLRAYLKNNPIRPYTENRAKLKEYVYNLHKNVRKRSGSKTVHTLEQVKSAFSSSKGWELFGNYSIF